LRYKLLPYLYTQAWQASQTGLPMVRPLFWPEADDPVLWGIDDAFYLGEALLVAPIVNEGATSRKLRLPRGSWYDFWEDERYHGPGEISLDCDLDRIPVLVAAGSVLPLEVADQLELHIYPPVHGEARSTIYTDAGDGYGSSRLDHFSQFVRDEAVDLNWKKEGDYPFPYKGVILQFHGAACNQLIVDGEIIQLDNNRAELGMFEVAQFNLTR
jgi:alpha-glucosidase